MLSRRSDDVTDDCDDGHHEGVELLRRDFGAEDLPRLRVLVEASAAAGGLPRARQGEFVLAVDEVARNAVEHAGGHGRLTVVRSRGELRCEVTDSGPGFTADVIPELLPGLDASRSGRGLWLARLVTDELTVTPGPGAGTVVTLTMRLPEG